MKKLISTMLSIMLIITLVATAHATGLPFEDVEPTDWYHDAVNYAYENGLFHGTSDTTFNPETTMTRAMFVTVLANMSNADINQYEQCHFLDVGTNAWYHRQVEWAVINGLTSGTGEFAFSPGEPVTREQAATFLYRYATRTDNDVSTVPANFHFKDYEQTSEYARTAIDWAISKKIINGDGNGKLRPKDTATRAEMAQMFMNAKNILKNKTLTKTDICHPPLPDDIDETIYGMTIEELVGQVFQARYPDADQADITARYHPGGYTFYEKDFKNKTESQVRDMIRTVQTNSGIPLFVAVDEEGGIVNRISTNPNLSAQPFRSMQEIYAASGLDGIGKDAETKARLLKSLGVNMNLAPVCDLSTNPDDYIYERTTGQDADTTSKIIKAIVKVMNENEILSSLKHFPGYGNNKNTHTGISIDKRTWEQFKNRDLKPFQAGIEAGTPCVLISHNIINCIDPDRPASLSKDVIKILRDDLGFNGIVMTDDLSMDAIKIYAGSQNPAVTAFQAGADLLLTSDLGRDYSALMDAVNNGTVTRQRLKESVRRILETKKEYLET